MSARTRFNPSGKQINDTNTAADNSASVKPSQISSSGALQDASNSPRPGCKNVDEGVTFQKSNEIKENDTIPINSKNSSGNLMGTDKPLNIGSLVRPRSKKNDSTSSPIQNRRPRNSTVTKLKENGLPLISRSSSHIPHSPTRLPENSASSFSLFASSNTHLLSDSLPTSPNSYQRLDSYKSETGMPSVKQNSSRIPVPRATANGNSTFNDPSSCEVFPLGKQHRESVEPDHSLECLSPPLSSHRRYKEEQRSYDTLVAIHDDDNENEIHSQQHEYRLRRTTKRISSEDVNEEEINYVREKKRTKINPKTRQTILEGNPESFYENQRSDPMTPVPYYQNIDHVYDSPGPRDPRNQTPCNQTPPAHLVAQTYSTSQSMPPARMNEEAQLIYRLLGVDMEKYLDDHIEQYDTAKVRWKSCTIEEWKEGASEITDKFNRLIDFVKDHMTTKLSLFANLHETVAKHKVVLKERENLLKDIREQLVKDSGNVLGSALGK